MSEPTRGPRDTPPAASPATSDAPAGASSVATSPAASDVPATASSASPAAPSAWRVRPATPEDVTAVAGAVHQLLRELGGTPPLLVEMETTARGLAGDPRAGALLVAERDGAIVGVLAASWQTAIHVPGPYALIQDLWVARSHRGQAIGGDLLAALFALARTRRMARVEVGLPREAFAGIRATEAFYLRNGFAPLGARMRRLLP